MLDYDKDIKEIMIGLLRVKTADIIAEDMPNEIMKDVFEICGRDAAIKMLLFLQGNIIQVPTQPWLAFKQRYILDNYDYTARSIKLIARTLCVSENYIRDVISRKKIQKIVPCEGQLSLKDEEKRIAKEQENEQ